MVLDQVKQTIGRSKIQQKSCGRKLDMVFKRNFNEYRWTECRVNYTTPLMDGGFKMTKKIKTCSSALVSPLNQKLGR